MANQELSRMTTHISVHRELLIEIISMLMAQGLVRSGTLATVDEIAAIPDHEEDPGNVPSTEFAEQAAFAAELRAILEAARARSRAGKS